MKLIICGCCGDHYDGTQDSRFDTGYGLCGSCSDEEQAYNQKQFKLSCALVASHLSEKNRKDFMGASKEKKARVINYLFEKGALTWAIGGK